MPRQFRPKTGFTDKSTAAIQIDDDGSSPEVSKDGSLKAAGQRNHLAQFVPTWTLPEMERLVASGSWEEINSQATAAELSPAPESVVTPAAE